MRIKPFLNENFLLENSTAERLFHEYARDLPIIDYHNHLSPQHISDNKRFKTITEAWLYGDHYKWRAMRANGIAEKYITGDASDTEKFFKWAETVPYTMRNPLYHWTHLELQRYFGIDQLLNPDSAEEIFLTCNTQLQDQDFTTVGLLEKFNVEIVCTTDEPTDSLKYHSNFNNKRRDSSFKMLPTFRPDQFLLAQHPAFMESIHKLEEISGYKIVSFEDLLEYLGQKISFFHSMGCRSSDHGLQRLFPIDYSHKNLDEVIKKAKEGKKITDKEAAIFQSGLLHSLAKIYYKYGWVMQLHLGPIRNNNDRLMKAVGYDAGCDSIGDYPQAQGLAYFLNKLDREDCLPKTILYNLNPSDNEVFSTMAGNFNDGSIAGKIQWGSAWWFLDQKDGIEKQLNTLSNMGLLSRFIGMLTDSRSFLSFPRHEYFRRILCNLLGKDVHQGELPNDINWLGKMVENICYHNASEYFEF